jgi:pimeloyl-ACP methyl ester carboxylesterase
LTPFIALEPPPLLLIHGVWSNAAATGFSSISPGFYRWISSQYPHNLIYAVDYGSLSSQAFSDPGIQSRLLSRMTNALASAAAAGMAARSVDVVAHSMGGLVTRYFLSTAGYSRNPALLPNPIHKLITIGTPHLGTNLATTLVNNQDQTTVFAASPLVLALCQAFSSCTLGDVFVKIGKPIGTAVQSMETGSPQLLSLSSANVFSSIVGTAPPQPGVCDRSIAKRPDQSIPARTNGCQHSEQPAERHDCANNEPRSPPGLGTPDRRFPESCTLTCATPC